MSSFGENLRRERELRGVSLRDIADATKISTRFLEAIEEGRLGILPGGVFQRSFVRQYARHLGLDADRIVADFDAAHPPEARSQPAPAAREWPLRAVGAVAVVLGLSALWWARPATRAEERTPFDVAPAEAAVPEPARPAPTIYAPVASAPAAAEPQSLVITLAASQDCWVGVEVDGEEVLNRVLAEGESRRLEAHSQIVLSVGNAGGLTLTVNDQTALPLGRSGEVRHNILITPQNLASFVALGTTPEA